MTLPDPLLAAELRRCLAIDQRSPSGLRWIDRPAARCNVLIGSVAGHKHSGGYWYVGFRGRDLKCHRVVFFLAHSYWPHRDVDHRNRDRGDNRVENLRPATRAQNCHNSKLRKDNKSGCKGVCWHALTGKWQVHIQGQRLGHFSNLDEAIAVRRQAEQQRFGEWRVE